jgi:uncharacterized protein (DUF1919 family)
VIFLRSREVLVCIIVNALLSSLALQSFCSSALVPLLGQKTRKRERLSFEIVHRYRVARTWLSSLHESRKNYFTGLELRKVHLSSILPSLRNHFSNKATYVFNGARVRNMLWAWHERKKLRRTDFSIICNDCHGGGIYQRMGLQYATPTIGLLFYSEDYINFLENFYYYIRQPLKFTPTSRHRESDEYRKINPYPIGILGDDVEIHFLHYKNERVAYDKWVQRTKRINFDNLFFIYSDNYFFREEFLDRYQKLPFKHKIFFSSKPRSNFECVVFIRDYANASHVGLMLRDRKYLKYLDLTNWLNGSSDFLK